MFDKNCRLIPAEDLQRLLCWIIHHANKHQGMVVYCGKQGGILYKVDMFDKNRRLIPAEDLQRLLCLIIHHANKHQGMVV